ncbi:MAG TPA: cytochrome c oxidase subunit II [Thermoanaerobaculia bacterium]|nr:cytochrome c oxidase subunit II [Thermoanaerobaculia bacterium]
MELFPQQASSFAPHVDALYGFLIAVTAFFSLLIGTLVVSFAIRYRRRSPGEIPPVVHESGLLELVWTVIPLGLVLIMFFWGAAVYFRITRPPTGAIEIYVTGKQWMWKIQHGDGHREMNELHVPVGQPVRLTMASEDVIHSFFVPAFRFKRDVVPGRFSIAWFEATKPGRYHLFCAEYCGTRHSGMIGWVYAMKPADYQAWLSGGAAGESLAAAGAKRFQEQACNTCHAEQAGARGPSLVGLFGKTVHLQGGQTVVADEAYLRESITNPQARLVEGYPPIMPTFQGLISEEGLLQLIAYIKSLSPSPAAGAAPPAPSTERKPAKP